jgi:hypothetical protein
MTVFSPRAIFEWLGVGEPYPYLTVITNDFMSTETLTKIIGLNLEEDYEDISAKPFEEIICAALSKVGRVKRQVEVSNRGDGRRGYIDFVLFAAGETVPIEADRRTPRQKSIFKVRSINPGNAFVVTRSPFRVLKD